MKRTADDTVSPPFPLHSQSRSPSMPVRRLRVGIALEKSNCSRWISNVSSTHARQLLQNINKVFRISRRKVDTFYTEIELKTTKNSGGKLRIDSDTTT
jgi:hypothetical protein